MVHALQEACRVLVPGGILVDLRPYSVEAPLEVGVQGEFELAGLVDTSLGEAHDVAADKAVRSMVRRGIIKQSSSEFFESAYYWRSIKGMLADLEDRWKEDVILPGAVLQQASLLYKKHPRRARLRIKLRSKLVLFKKR